MPRIIFLLCFAVPLFCMAQSQLARMYDYDASGNRTTCVVINLSPPKAPENPPDTTEVEVMSDELRVTSDELQVASDELQVTSDELYFVERMGNVEIKIYPNPTTEKITLEFSGIVETRLIASLRLYSLNGQLLPEQPVHSSSTVVSLAGLAKGTYILKVQINGRTEDWKIIKQ
jgi:hypothetical protein